MSNGNDVKNARSGATAMGATDMIVAALKAKALQDPGIDDNYICVLEPSIGGNSQFWKAHAVKGPVGNCPHRNTRNNFEI